MKGFVLRLIPHRYYTEESLRCMGLSGSTLARARERDGLRCKEIGKRQRMYKGQWVIDWLERSKP